MKVDSFLSPNSKLRRFFNSFSPSSRAALILSVPFTLIDAIHYYTAGTAIAISLPLLLVIYLACGFLAARFSIAEGQSETQARKSGFSAGIKLWATSTIINTLVSVFAGTLSLGLTLVLGIPYLLLCGPVLLALGGLAGWLGALINVSIHRRLG